MNKRDFTIETLDKLGIPHLSPTGKSIIDLILLGYRKAGWSAGGASKITKKYLTSKPTGRPIFTGYY